VSSVTTRKLFGDAFRDVPRVQRSAEVREQLQAAIESGRFAAGDRLPSERELVEMTGVSRVSVREAIRALEAIGLVEVVHGRGSFVAKPREAKETGLREWLADHGDELMVLLRLRGAVHELAAERAAEIGDREAIAEVRAAYDAFVAADPEDGAALADTDRAFHVAVARASHSSMLEDFTQNLHAHLVESHRLTFASPGRSRRSAREHLAVVKALEAGDPAAARRAMARHMQAVLRLVQQFLDADGEADPATL
jgi:GntR family transcriptional repressor for pyruvate dehydrogenase complex